VLVTGGAGFIGSHVVDYYLSQKTDITVVDNLVTGRIENLRHNLDNPQLKFVMDSILNRQTMEPLIAEADLVYNLAAPVGVKFIMNHPVHTLLDNVRGIDCVLEYCNKYRKKVLVASSSEVYGRNLEFSTKGKSSLLNEDSVRVMGATSNHRWAYANTKAFDEFLALAYKKEFGLPVVVVRFFNIIGPRQTGDFGMVVPSFIKKALNNDSIEIYGTGTQTRTFFYVKDAISAMVGLMNLPAAYGEVYNIGGSDEISIIDLAKKVIQLTKSKSKIKVIDYKTAYGDGFEDMLRRTPDTAKLKKTINFTQYYHLDKMLLEIIQSVKKQLNAG